VHNVLANIRKSRNNYCDRRLYQFPVPHRNHCMKYLYHFSLCLLVLLSSSCLKNAFVPKADPKVFSCKINGQSFVPRPTILFPTANATLDNIGVTIYTGNNAMDLKIRGVSEGTGVYEFDLHWNKATYRDHATGKNYVADSLGHGSITLQNYHPGARYITGTFWFNAVNQQDPTDSVKVTDGHFYITALNKHF